MATSSANGIFECDDQRQRLPAKAGKRHYRGSTVTSDEKPRVESFLRKPKSHAEEIREKGRAPEAAPGRREMKTNYKEINWLKI